MRVYFASRRTLPSLGSRAINSLLRPSHCRANSGSAKGVSEPGEDVEGTTAEISKYSQEKKIQVKRRRHQRQREALLYQASAIAATMLFLGLAVGATYYRFFFHSHENFPVAEFWCTLFMIFGGMVGMEMYARWAHKALWHDFEPGWAIHKSHHEARVGPFEDNDIFAVINAVPAIALTAYGFFTPSEWGGICFGLGMGITIFGIAYMFVHDGLVHKRFPVGPISELPQLKRIAIAHKIHHTDKFGGMPYGMFLGPQELEAIGASDELERLVAQSIDGSKSKCERS